MIIKNHAYATVTDKTGETDVSTGKDEQMMDKSEVRDVHPNEVMMQAQQEQADVDMKPEVSINIEHKDDDAYGSQ